MRLFLNLFILVFSFSISAQETPPEEKPLVPAERPKPRQAPMPGVMGTMGLQAPQTPQVLYSGMGAPASEGPPIWQDRLSVAFPVLMNEKRQLALSLSGSQLHIGERLSLADTNTLLEKDYYRAELGMQFSRQMERGRSWGLRGSLGYATDKLFTDSRDLAFNLTATYSYPGEKGQWILLVYMTNNGALPNYVPIPGFIYMYRKDNFTGLFGLPFVALQWMPAHPWTYSLSLFGPNATTDLAYSLGMQQVYLGAGWNPQSFMRTNREQREDRIFVDEKRVFLGWRSPLLQGFFGDLQVGYNFARRIHEGPGLFNKEKGYVDLKDSWSIAWTFRYGF